MIDNDSQPQDGLSKRQKVEQILRKKGIEDSKVIDSIMIWKYTDV